MWSPPRLWQIRYPISISGRGEDFTARPPPPYIFRPSYGLATVQYIKKSVGWYYIQDAPHSTFANQGMYTVLIFLEIKKSTEATKIGKEFNCFADWNRLMYFKTLEKIASLLAMNFFIYFCILYQDYCQRQKITIYLCINLGNLKFFIDSILYNDSSFHAPVFLWDFE